ncbi:hypothetical protein D9M69_725350 [compost metagenome]
MADDENSGAELPKPTTPPTQPSGTANLLQNYSDFMSIEEEYDRCVASGLLRKSLNPEDAEEQAYDYVLKMMEKVD